MLGSILRIDVEGDPYAIPPENPYATGGGAPEVWAKGLRNPWRFSFDGELIYIGDVGQGAWEEIDVAPVGSRGLNFGWSVTEGIQETRAWSDTLGPVPGLTSFGLDGVGELYLTTADGSLYRIEQG